MRLIVTVAVVIIASLSCNDIVLAQLNPDMFIADSGKKWVAGRDKTQPMNGYVAIVLHIEDDPGMVPRQYVRAQMWGYTGARDNNRRYDGMERVTPSETWLKGEVAQIGTGRNRRQQLTLRSDDTLVTVWLTSMVQRSKKKTGNTDEEVILCRWKDLREGRGKEGEKFECEDPPTEDILEEEENVDPEAMMEEMDPAYYP